GNDGDPDGFPTVDAKTLKSMLAVYPGLFEGYGEIGLYARENGGSPELPPDSQRLQEIYPIVRQNKLAVYFHLGDGHKDNFERILKANPDINFVWHGDQLSIDEIEDILTKYPNAHYGLEIIGEGSKLGIFPLFVGKSKQAYLDAVEQKFDDLLRYDVRTWKSVIERHPNQVVWGTDRADAEWNYYNDVGQLMVKYARAFIGKLDPSVQEKFAYKNAEKLVGGTQ
ncbi:MAG TPA: amidohydrolase family protein, partial [Candidatus Nanoarchaeia archaeon]|nr:amidohydrolase family protein [Candidatus Nanoarchaeia archaeon]